MARRAVRAGCAHMHKLGGGLRREAAQLQPPPARLHPRSLAVPQLEALGLGRQPAAPARPGEHKHWVLEGVGLGGFGEAVQRALAGLRAAAGRGAGAGGWLGCGRGVGCAWSAGAGGAVTPAMQRSLRYSCGRGSELRGLLHRVSPPVKRTSGTLQVGVSMQEKQGSTSSMPVTAPAGAT